MIVTYTCLFTVRLFAVPVDALKAHLQPDNPIGLFPFCGDISFLLSQQRIGLRQPRGQVFEFDDGIDDKHNNDSDASLLSKVLALN